MNYAVATRRVEIDTLHFTLRSSHRLCSINTCTGVSFFKKRLQHRRFPVNIEKFLRTPIHNNICERLLLYLATYCIISYN